jgi:phage recombination protein Bet
MTSNLPAPVERTKANSVMVRMAERFGMDRVAFERTLMATVVPGGKATPEQVAAVLLVADQYHLNPLTKEIYAFPSKGGGIVPVVGVDGWIKLMNEHPAADGVQLVENNDEKGALVSVTATVHRKDRTHPITVTEYYAECARGTDPWRTQPRRMLRHKALIQGLRVAFGFSGIYEPDEAERIVEAQQRERVIEASATTLSSLTDTLEAQAQVETEKEIQ